MKVKVDIHKLSEHLSEEYYMNLEMGDEVEFNTERIHALALKKIHGESLPQPTKERKPMKHTPKRLLVAAVAVAALTTTAYAASKTDFFKEIFGNSVSEGDIQLMNLFAENDDFKMTAEQLISDGFNTKIIVSLEGKSRKGKELLSDHDRKAEIVTGFVSEKEVGLSLAGTERLPQFDTKEKSYYCVNYSGNQDYREESLILTLERFVEMADLGEMGKTVAEPNLSLVIENPKSIDTRRTIAFAVPEEQDGAYPLSITVNAISAVLEIYDDGSENTPTLDVVMVMKDGSQNQVFDGGWIQQDGATGGGGVALSDDPEALPLSSGHSFQRDLETNRILQTASFSKIINPDEAEYLLIGGERYDF